MEAKDITTDEAHERINRLNRLIAEDEHVAVLLEKASRASHAIMAHTLQAIQKLHPDVKGSHLEAMLVHLQICMPNILKVTFDYVHACLGNKVEAEPGLMHLCGIALQVMQPYLTQLSDPASIIDDAKNDNDTGSFFSDDEGNVVPIKRNDSESVF